MAERFMIHFFEFCDGCIRVCIGLKIDKKLFCLVSFFCVEYPIADLRGYRKRRLTGGWPKAVIIAINASADAKGAVSVWAGKTGIHIDLVYLQCEFLSHIRTEGVISLHDELSIFTDS
jgi:hypothetical protein